MNESSLLHPSAPKPALRRKRSPFRDIFELVLLVLLTFTPINLMTARAIVKGPSMLPTFRTDNLVIVNRMAYFFSRPQRGDVVVLHNPNNPQGDDLIKRIVALPGETVEIRGGVVFINGVQLNEPYVREYCGCNGTWTLGVNQYFVLGDNRNNSYDSHNFGPIDRSLIVGQAWIKYWPLAEFEFVHHPRYDNLP